MASFKGYIRLPDGSDELFWNEIDVEGVVEDCNQFLGWDNWTVYQQIFYTNPPTPVIIPPTPPDPPDPPPVTPEAPTTGLTHVFYAIDNRTFEAIDNRTFEI